MGQAAFELLGKQPCSFSCETCQQQRAPSVFASHQGGRRRQTHSATHLAEKQGGWKWGIKARYRKDAGSDPHKPLCLFPNTSKSLPAVPMHLLSPTSAPCSSLSLLILVPRR